MKAAIIDLGTNAARLFIFEIEKTGQASLVFQKRLLIGLGKSLYDNNSLNPDAIVTGIETFKIFEAILKEHRPAIIKAIATSAMRTAKNSDEYIDAIEEQTGICLEVISDSREAELLAKGVLENEKIEVKHSLLVDLGGGSTELVCCINNKVACDFSLEIGALRAQALYLKSHPPVKGGVDKLRAAVKDILAPCVDRSPFRSPDLVIGSSGSLRAFGKIHNNIEGSQEYSRDFLGGFINRLSEMSLEEIDQVATMLPKRAEHILAAGIIIDEILKAFDANLVRPSAFAIKDGLLVELIDQLKS